MTPDALVAVLEQHARFTVGQRDAVRADLSRESLHECGAQSSSSGNQIWMRYHRVQDLPRRIVGVGGQARVTTSHRSKRQHPTHHTTSIDHLADLRFWHLTAPSHSPQAALLHGVIAEMITRCVPAMMFRERQHARVLA